MITAKVQEFINSFLGTDSTEIRNEVREIDRAHRIDGMRVETAAGAWIVGGFEHRGRRFVQVQEPNGKIYYEVPLMKESKDKIVVPSLKPRDPNQRVLANKKNAAGAHRDKKRDMKNGEGKYQKKTFKEWLMTEGERGSNMVDEHPFSIKLLYKGKGRWPKLKGEIYEGDVLIGTFTRAAVQQGYIPPIEYKFRTERAKARFDDFADSNSIEETIEALLPLGAFDESR